LPIVDSLARRPDLAFTAREVIQMLAATWGRTATLEEVELALDTLLSEGRLQKEEIEGQQWYAYTIDERRLGFLRE
jgi:hypothetical protein